MIAGLPKNSCFLFAIKEMESFNDLGKISLNNEPKIINTEVMSGQFRAEKFYFFC
jgi:hypothetical protein